MIQRLFNFVHQIQSNSFSNLREHDPPASCRVPGNASVICFWILLVGWWNDNDCHDGVARLNILRVQGRIVYRPWHPEQSSTTGTSGECPTVSFIIWIPNSGKHLPSPVECSGKLLQTKSSWQPACLEIRWNTYNLRKHNMENQSGHGWPL